MGLNIPDSEYYTITGKYDEEKSDYVEPLLDWYLNHYPAPSWSHVATALYNYEEHEVLQALRDQIPQLTGIL